MRSLDGVSLVYFIQAGTDGPIKIGRTTNIRRRLTGIQTGSAQRLVVLGTMPGDEAAERALHSRFGFLRTVGEWFRSDATLMQYIEAHADKGASRDGHVPHPLKTFMRAHGITATQFAAHVSTHGEETTASYISQIVIGYRKPGGSLAVAIADATGGHVTVDDLLRFPKRAA
jgi:hypothetical protein